MGLDTTHGCWHGAYSAFSRWRDGVALAAGYRVWPVQYAIGTRNTIILDWGHLPEGHLLGEWPETPADPLLVLLTHQDCEGVIHPRDAGPLADRLESLLDKLPEENDPGHIGNWRACTCRFIAGLRLASNNNEDVVFG